MPIPPQDTIPCNDLHPIPSHLPLLPPALLLAAHHRRRRTRALLLASIRRTQRRLLPEVNPDHILHAASVMFDKAHVCQARTSRPLRRALHDLDALHQRTVHLVPHLHAHARELPAEQDRRVDAAAPDVDADACEGVAGALPHK
jgi:hypothetical protein